MPGTVEVIAAPGALSDVGTAAQVLTAVAVRLGVEARLLVCASPAEFSAAVAAAQVEPVVLPVDPADLHPGRDVVRLDLTERGADRSPGVRRHVRGRGLAGIGFAVAAVVHHALSPATRVPYGAHPDQHVDLRLPAGSGPFPLAVLVHGGYWRARWDDDTIEAVALDLTARGLATANLGYRFPAEHGWDATTADVEAGFTAAVGSATVDRTRVVLLGHSAGGQLAVRLAADLAAAGRAPVLTVSLAGVLDLVTIDARWSSEGAVSAALGGRAGDLPAVYAASSPLARIPVGAPVAVVVGTGDDPDLLDASRTYVAAARAAGDDVTVVEEPGAHDSVVDPTSAIWASVVEVVTARVRA